MYRRPPRSTRTDNPFPYTPPFRSLMHDHAERDGDQGEIGFARAHRGHAQNEAEECGDDGRRDQTAPEADAEMNGEKRRRIGADAVGRARRSEEHTSELQSLMRTSYAVFCLKKKKNNEKKGNK